MRGKKKKKKQPNMGSQKICLLLIVFFMYLYMFAAASTPLHNEDFPSDSLEDIDKGNKHIPEQEHSTVKANVDHYTRTGIVESSKFAHGTSFGGAHARGGPSDFGEHGSNGGSGATYTQGGSNVIPIYAAGAASNRHPNTHHNAGSRNQNSTRFLTLILTALAWLLHLYSAQEN